MASMTYRAAGVDIDAGDALVERIKPLARATARAGVLGGIGGFGALFDLKAAGLPRSGAGLLHRRRRHQAAHRHRHRPARHASASTWSPCASTTWWCRAPSRCSSSTISPPAGSRWSRPRAVIAGIAEGCRLAGCALVGGETAEMPGMYARRRLRPRRLRRRRRRARRAAAARAWRRATRCSAWPAAACIPTAFRWCAASSRPPAPAGTTPAPVRRGRHARRGAAGADAHLCALAAGAAPRRPAEGGRPHHRRRPARQPAARAAGRHARRARRRRLAAAAGVRLARPHRRRRAGGDAAGVQLRHRHGGGDRRRPTPPRAVLEAAGETVFAIGRIEAAAGGRRAGDSASTCRRTGWRVKRRVGILISGRGSNMAALLRAAADAGLPRRDRAGAVQQSGRPGAGRSRARPASPPPAIDHRPFRRDRAAHEAALADGAATRPGSRSSAWPATCGC